MLSHYHVLNARMLFPSHADTGLTHWLEKWMKNKWPMLIKEMKKELNVRHVGTSNNRTQTVKYYSRYTKQGCVSRCLCIVLNIACISVAYQHTIHNSCLTLKSWPKQPAHTRVI